MCPFLNLNVTFFNLKMLKMYFFLKSTSFNIIPASAGMEEELIRKHAGVEGVLDEAFRRGLLAELLKVRQAAVAETIRHPVAGYGLLSHARHLE